ncbi:hypothetical protein CBL_02967 [Carabus blaptoides fortunei]
MKKKITGQKNARLKPSQVQLKFFAGEILKSKREVKIECEHKGREHKLLFQVVETKRNSIFGYNFFDDSDNFIMIPNIIDNNLTPTATESIEIQNSEVAIDEQENSAEIESQSIQTEDFVQTP